MVVPRLVFISNSTEIGTIYTKAELTALSTFCKEHHLWLYLDGARIGVALTAKNSDVKIEELCNLVDVFYIGGTKNGAMLGEAIVIVNDTLKTHFRHLMKQK
jgi:threonine aldolase